MDDLIARMQQLLSALPERIPSELRVGPGVLAALRRIADKPADRFGLHALSPLAGVRIVEDDSYLLGEWRMLDQHGDQMRAGNTRAYGHPFRSFMGAGLCITWLGDDLCGLPPGQHVDTDRCPRCGDRLYTEAETEQHNRDVHGFGPTLTTSWGAEP